VAFKTAHSFAAFLRDAVSHGSVSESAPASNFLLEERLTPEREAAFLAEDPPAAGPPWNFQTEYGNHFTRHVGVSRLRPRTCHTFGNDNKPAWSVWSGMQSHRDVVRLESVRGLFERNPSGYRSAEELADVLKSLVAGNLSDDDQERFRLWLRDMNGNRDGRPMFAAPWGEVEPLLSHADWPRRLRNAMGLVHLFGTSASLLPVVLMRYNLSRSETAAKTARLAAWAATPTVLEAGGNGGPNAAFFPFPEAAVGTGGLGFGQTVDLSDGGTPDFTPELVHFRIDYELTDFRRVGEISDMIDDDQLAIARARHLSLLESDLKHRSKLP
jgi:hypothetical protein